MLNLLGARTLRGSDAAAVLRALDQDPVASCSVAAHVEHRGLCSEYGQFWSDGAPDRSLCFSGASLIPLFASSSDLDSFADRAVRSGRRCSSIVGRSDLALDLWSRLEREWGPARDIRSNQPLMVLRQRSPIAADPAVRRVRADELDAYLAAAVEMFIAEVGVDPRRGDGGASYRRRIAGLIAAGRAWARFVDGQVVYKAEIGALSTQIGQIQGVWVHPQWRGSGIGAAGTASIANAVVNSGRAASLYVNDFNTAARAAYRRAGFSQVGTFATILFD